MIWAVVKLLIKSQKPQKNPQVNNSETIIKEHDKEMPKEIQTQLQMSMIKCLKKDIYL